MSYVRRLAKLNRFNFHESWKNWLIRISYIFLQQTDLILTIYGISHGFYELNPIVLHLYSSPVQLIVVKALIPLIIASILPAKLLIPAGALLLFVNIWDLVHLILL